jgi:hypothetical protein
MPEPTEVADDFEAVKERMLARAQAQRCDVYRIQQRLERKFGLGDKPVSRRKLYKWLADLADEHGEPVLVVVSTAVAQAVSARNPDRYFCAVVKRLISEAKIASIRGPEEAKW